MTLGNIPQQGQRTFILVLVMDLETLSGLKEGGAAGRCRGPVGLFFSASSGGFLCSQWVGSARHLVKISLSGIKT